MRENKMNGRIIWDKVFTDKDFDFYKEYEGMAHNEIHDIALASGLSGWGCCSLDKAPENFGHGMIKISKIVGTSLPDELMKIAKMSKEKRNES